MSTSIFVTWSPSSEAAMTVDVDAVAGEEARAEGTTEVATAVAVDEAVEMATEEMATEGEETEGIVADGAVGKATPSTRRIPTLFPVSVVHRPSPLASFPQGN